MRRIPRQPGRRMPVPQVAARKLQTKTFPAPVRGWIANENLALSRPGGAFVLDGWFPTTTTVRLMGGSIKWATISEDPVLSMFTYASGTTEKFFAADAENIFEITSPASTTVIPDPKVEGQTSGYYSTTQIGTAGGDFLFAVNGTEAALLYDGTDFYPVTGTALHELDYDAESAAFTEGATLTGGTSLATATIVKVIDNGATGTLWINNISGTFQNDEAITDSATGSATANGTSSLLAGAITGVTTSTLSYVWNFASRLFFIEKGTMNVRYLAVDAISGAASQFSLAGVMQKGGELMFGATWSLDAGDGLDDKCVFVSSEGEVAVYEGTNPGDANAWSKVGVYQITEPLGALAHIRAGGDLLVATQEGIVPLSEALQKDSAALSLAAVSRAIEPEWRTEVTRRRTLPWKMIKWAANNMLVVSQPAADATQASQCLIANLETGAWCKRTGWDTRCIAVFGDRGFFGTNDGVIYEMDVAGSDDGTPYTCVMVMQFDHLGSSGFEKTVMQGRTVYRAASPFIDRLSVSRDYTVSLPSAPGSVADYVVDEWDVGLWDDAQWDAGTEYVVTAKWRSIGQSGFVIAPQVQITSGTTPKPRVELVAVDLTYEQGAIVV